MQFQNLPLDVKIAKSRLRIREWYEHYGGQVNVSFSGGKDSSVLLHLVRSLYPEVPAVFSDTGLEFPQMYEHIDKFERETGLNITRVKPDMPFEYLMFDKPINRRDESPIKIKYGADKAGHGT